MNRYLWTGPLEPVKWVGRRLCYMYQQVGYTIDDAIIELRCIFPWYPSTFEEINGFPLCRQNERKYLRMDMRRFRKKEINSSQKRYESLIERILVDRKPRSVDELCLEIEKLPKIVNIPNILYAFDVFDIDRNRIGTKIGYCTDIIQRRNALNWELTKYGYHVSDKPVIAIKISDDVSIAKKIEELAHSKARINGKVPFHGKEYFEIDIIHSMRVVMDAANEFGFRDILEL